MSSEDDMCHAKPSEGGDTSHAPSGATSPGHPGDAKEWPEREPRAQEIVMRYSAYINATPALMSLLYDVDYLPEQIVTTKGAIVMAAIVEAYKIGTQISRDAILEEAAKVADAEGKLIGVSKTDSGEWACETIANNIRALKASPRCQDEVVEPAAKNAKVYLMAQRKAWHHDVPQGWVETHWERFDYVECAIYEKPVADLTEADRKFWDYYAEEPCGWIEPARTKASPQCEDEVARSASEVYPQGTQAE